jgi:hypothetical protein
MFFSALIWCFGKGFGSKRIRQLPPIGELSSQPGQIEADAFSPRETHATSDTLKFSPLRQIVMRIYSRK